MKSKPSVFQPIPLATFSSWAKSAHIVSAQIVKVERWKYLRSTTFWHEFLLIKLAPSSHFAASDLEPPLGSVPPDELDKFTTLLHSGLQVRFDRRVRDDVVCFVGSDDEVDIRLECSLVSTVARREYDNPALLSSIDEHYLGPSLGDIIFFLADMLALHSPSYNLFSRNCWTFASSTVALLEQSFLGDVVTQAVVDKSDTDLVMNMRQRLKAGLGQLFGSPDLGQHVSDAEAFGVSNEAMLTQFGPGTFRFHKDIQEILRSVRRDNERIDPHGRVISKYKRVDGSSTERTSIPLKNHPFRGFMRALGNCDALARDSPSNILDLLFGFQRIVTRPEWVSEALSPGPHVQIAKHLSVAWSTALAADRTLDALLTVLTPFSLPLLNSESVGVKEARVTAIYELYLESSAILDDWAALISISNRPKGLSLNRAHFETLLEMFIPFLTTMSSNEKIRLRLAASGIFRHLLELILDKTCTDMLRALSLELLVLYLDEKYDGVDPKEAAAASVDLLTKRGLSPVTLYSGYRIIQMLIQSSLPASKSAAYRPPSQ